ncbi:MAG: CPBP family intramembrane metalloprotease [Spirochaetaceae bacterium]|nr:CPBP family intramembrane metalloprotease [Spirochaetaceae bacterium]
MTAAPEPGFSLPGEIPLAEASLEPENTVQDQGSLLRMAVFVEGGMGLLAIALGYFTGYNPLAEVRVDSLGWLDGAGLLAVLPMFLLFLGLTSLRFPSLELIRAKMDQVILPLFKGLYLSDVFWLSILAGVGEELLFRGFFHLWMEDWFGMPVAVALTAILFGLVHWITPMYALLAGLMGALLSATMLLTDNLLVAILVHGLYDFVALSYYLRVVHKAGPNSESP